MKWATLATALLPLVAAYGFTHEQYASGEVMDLMMSGKEVRF
jgi:predicted ester cyclase